MYISSIQAQAVICYQYDGMGNRTDQQWCLLSLIDDTEAAEVLNDITNIASSDIEDMDTAVSFSPNPTDHILNITDDHVGEVYSISCRNAVGKVVKQWKEVRAPNTLNVSELRAGTYYLIVSGNKRSIHKLIIL